MLTKLKIVLVLLEKHMLNYVTHLVLYYLIAFAIVVIIFKISNIVYYSILSNPTLLDIVFIFRVQIFL